GGTLEWVRADALTTNDSIAAPRWVGTHPMSPLFCDFLSPNDTIVRLQGDRSGQRRLRLADVLPDINATHPRIESLATLGGGFRSSELRRVPLYLDEDIGYLCGLISSDGYYGKPGGRSIAFVNTNLALHDRLSEIIRTHFDYVTHRHLNAKRFDLMLPQGTQPKSLKDCYTTFINNRLLCMALRNVQSRILEMPASIIASWLRGMFDGDGCVRVDANAPQLVISAWDPSRNRLVRDALLRIGVVTSMSPGARNGRDGNVVITGLENLRRFVSAVGTEHPEKLPKLDAIWDWVRQRTTSSSRHDGVAVGAVLREARQSIGMGQRSFTRGNQVSAYERGLVTPSRTSLQAVVDEMETWNPTGTSSSIAFETLRDLANSAIHWSRIESIERLPSNEPVYDLCLDQHHCFVANNLIVHNCIIFIDEIDAVGRHRGAGLGGGHDEREQTLNQLLVEMDGFDSNEGVIMIAATNRPDVLDPALMRPGRFDRQIVVDWPDIRGREGILKVHTRNIPLSDDVDLKLLARATPGMAGADIANLVNEAALLAARRNHKKVSLRDFYDAKDKVMLGMERRSLVMTDAERRTTAYHEAGHALVAWLMPGSDPVDKVTIIPRGRALGITSWIPAEERYTRSKDDLLRVISMAMGGRAAERLIFNHFTTGAANDLERATSLARRMVCELGMSENLGPLTFGKKEEMVFLGREIATHKDYSEQTAISIDQEVRAIAEQCYQRAFGLLQQNVDKLHLLANTLLEREVLDGDQMNRLLRGEPLEPLPASEPEAEATPQPSEENQAARRGEGPQLDPFNPPKPRPAGA
ncbi:MAG TPA: AAA family ATPase, partial [Candidatus Limnocylindria bacterium]|nr:AAA family ATPase [Candidatus Limnocylindria bacterium]